MRNGELIVKIRWLLSAVAAFMLLSYLGIWICTLLLDDEHLGDPLIDRIAKSSPESEPIGHRRIGSGSEEPLPGIAQDLVRDAGFELSDTEVDPGGFLVLSVYGIKDPTVISVKHPFGAVLRFYPSGDHLTALLPVKFTYAPGSYLLSAEGGGYQENFTITVREKIFPTEKLTVEQGTVDSTVESDAANREYFSRVQPIKFDAMDHPLWEGAFALPLDGRLTSGFGLQRITNGKPGERHGGIDLAAPTGTDVLSSNAGKVLFSDLVALTGNTVCIEHGLGLKSWYYHMDSLNVKTGDVVKKGQKIGEVGTTGFSNGPHLHFAISIWNIYVDPSLLLGKELIL